MTGTGSACGDVFAQAPNAGACRTSACCKNEEVVDTRSVVACTECHVHWNLDLEVAKCTDPDHTHQRFEVHRHRSVVVLPSLYDTSESVLIQVAVPSLSTFRWLSLEGRAWVSAGPAERVPVVRSACATG
jgi:hypothetical protein